MLISWAAPALVFFGIWWFLMKRMGGGMGHGMLEIGKSKAKVYMQTEMVSYLDTWPESTRRARN